MDSQKSSVLNLQSLNPASNVVSFRRRSGGNQYSGICWNKFTSILFG